MDWQGKWIWSGSGSPNIYARREFEVPAAPDAEASVSCSSQYKLYLNGKYIGRGPCPRSLQTQYYDTHDLSHVLRAGKNVIAAICRHSDVEQSEAGFLLQLTIHRNGDDTTVVCTDDAWKVKAAEEWGASSEYGEFYDSRKKPVGWNVVGFDDGAWEAARVVGDPDDSLVPRQIPPLKEWEVHPRHVLSATGVKYAKELLSPSGDVAVVSPGSDATVALDFAMEVVGFAGLRIRGGGCGTVDIAYSEILDDHGDLYTQSIDSLVLHGGRQEWQTFGRHAFRYIQLTFRNLDMPVSLESVYLTRVGYPVEQVSTFKCSDDVLNEIWRVGVYTLSLCMQDCYECCAGSVVQNAIDARLQALFNYYCFFDWSLAAQALSQTAASVQSADERAAWIEMLHEYYLYTADLGVVTELYLELHRLAVVDDENSPEIRAALRNASKLAVAASSTEDAKLWHDLATALPAAEGEAADAGPQSLFLRLRALAEQEKTQEALDLIREMWGGMLERGATTWWSSFPPAESASRCSGASGAPTYFLPAEILGVKPGLPGSEVTIQPRVGDLEWAQGRVKMVTGEVDVEWHMKDGVFTIDIEAPEPFIVALPVQDLKNPIVDEIDLTPETPERRARKTYGWGSTIWRDGQEHDPYVDWLKTQETDPPSGYERRQRCTAGGCYIWVRESVSTHVRYEVRDA